MKNLSQTFAIDEKVRILPLYINSAGEDLLDTVRRLYINADHYVLISSLEGTFYIESEESTATLKKNHGMILNKDRNYCFFTKKDRCKLRYVTFDGSGVLQILSYIGLDNSKTFLIDSYRFEADFHTIQLNIHTNNGYRASLSFQQILYEVFNTAAMQKGSRNIDLLNRYILENYCSNLDIQLLADVYGTSASYLCREFKSKYGTSPMAYVNQLRINKSRDLLAHTRKKIFEIARICGFINTEYFCSVFKKYEHCTPLQYRHSHTALTDDTIN